MYVSFTERTRSVHRLIKEIELPTEDEIRKVIEDTEYQILFNITAGAMSSSGLITTNF